MSQIILIPVCLDALYLKHGTSVAQAKVDFSRLPYFNGIRDFHTDTVNLSESVISQPFQNRNLYLKSGIHLHWALPDTLTRGVHTQEGTKFPAVPNRWLVIRRLKEVEQKWIVESDFLHLPDTGYQMDSVTYPIRYPYESDEALKNAPPFCYLGRKLPFDKWQSQRHLRNSKYLDRLTAIGYGEPTFAAFYPNCRSVFGFHDREYSGNQGVPDGLQYDLFGWYSNPDQDYLKEFVEQFKQSEQHKKPTLEEIQIEIEKQLQWQGIKLNSENEFPQIVCYSRITFKPPTTIPPIKTHTSVELAVGNTGIEALSAYLAKKIGDNNKAIVEDQLEALHFAESLENSLLDIGVKFQQARHEAGFNGVAAGYLWEIRAETNSPTNTKTEQSQSPSITPPLEIATLLQEINRTQQEYDRASQEIISRQQQLFADWYKYMVCTYPPEASWDDYPNVDEVKAYIEQQGINPLINKISATGEFSRQQDNSTISANSIAAHLVNLINQLVPEINRLNQESLRKANGQPTTTYKLEQIASPRYWEPKEPVVLLVGEDIKATKRHGQDGILKCLLFDQTIEEMINNSFQPVVEQINKITANSHTFGLQTWENQPWNPILLDWLVELFMVQSPANTPPGKYAHNFTTANYILKEQGIDLSAKSTCQVKDSSGKANNLVPTYKDFNIYSGSSILTNYAENLLTERIEKYLQKTIRERSNGINQVNLKDKQELDNLEKWCCDRPQTSHPDISLEKGNIINPVYQAICDYEKILQARNSDSNLKQYLWETIPDKYKKEKDLKFHQIKYLEELNNIIDLKAWYKTHKLEQIPDPILTAILAYKELQSSKLNSLSQALGGFNESLLMHKQTLQLLIDEPIGFPSYQEFTHEVRNAIAGQTRTAPQPLNDFRPIRAGEMRIIDLQLVDTFGQVRQLQWRDPNNPLRELIVAPETMKTTVQNRVVLPPRLVQPARINFQWLSASDRLNRMNQEASDRPDESPICGWIVPNNLDESLAIFNGLGKALGEIKKAVNSEAVNWESAPGETEITIYQIPNLHLRKVVQQIQRLGTGFFQGFCQVISNALENIQPETAIQAQVLLLSRPIAVVRAAVNLELQGIPAINQNWQVFRQEMQARKLLLERETNGFTSIEFPIRIGEYKRFNDSLIGYWREKDNSAQEGGYEYEGDKFYSPQSESEESQYIETQHWDTSNNLEGEEEGPINIVQSINKPPQRLTMLVDPRGEIHATSGILPTKTIRIRPEQYLKALEAIEVSFFTSPILMTKEQYALPLPSGIEYSWSWLERRNTNNNDAWLKVETVPTIAKQKFLQGYLNIFHERTDGDACWQELITKKWLKEINGNSSKAEIIPVKEHSQDQGQDFPNREQDSRQPLSEPWSNQEKTIVEIITQHQIVIKSATSQAVFSGSQEIREGWLVLKRMLQ